jgi:hypothetical protein
MCLEVHLLFTCGHEDMVSFERCPVSETIGDTSMCDLDIIFQSWATILCDSCQAAEDEDDDED